MYCYGIVCWILLNLHVSTSQYNYYSRDLNSITTMSYPKGVLDFIYPTFFSKRYLTWQYISKEQWEQLKAVNPLMTQTTYERDLKILRRAFADLGEVFPWLKFREQNKYGQILNIKFISMEDNTDGYNIMAHAHVQTYTITTNICLAKPFWQYPEYQYPIIIHEILHLLGNSHNNHNYSIMSNDGGSYKYGRIMYRDIITTNYAYFRNNYKEYLISFKKYKNIIKKTKHYLKFL